MSWQSPQPPAASGNVSPPSVERWLLLFSDQHLVGVDRIDRDADVVAGAADQGAVPAHDTPGGARIVRAPQRSLVRSLDQRVHAVGIRRRNRDVDLPDWRLRQAGVFGLLPGRAAVFRDVDAAARAAAEHGPGVHARLPTCRRSGRQDCSRPSRGRSSRCSG